MATSDLNKVRLISVRRAIVFAWSAFKAHWGLFVAILLSEFLAWVALELVVISGQRFGILLWLVAHLAFLIFFASVQVGFLRICLALRDQHEPAFVQAFAALSIGVRFLAALSVYVLIVALGLVLLIWPGIYLGARYVFLGYCFAELDPTVVDAFRSAARLASGSIPVLAPILATVLLFNLLGAALLGVGLLITIPTSGLFLADVYRQVSFAGQARELVSCKFAHPGAQG